MIARSRRAHSARGRPPSANRPLGVETRDLTRVFERSGKRRREAGPVVALDRVTLEVPPGEVHGLLGPNGAGKTTLCKILSTVLLPTSGSARVDGHDVVREAEAVRSVLAIVFGGERGLYLRLTARQSLRYWHALYLQPPATRASRVDEVLELVGLRDRADDPVETYSRGMKQRLHLARGLLADPRVIILDEPTLGMDPVGVRAFRTLVRELCTAGRALLITTHDMDEAEHVCDRVSLIDDGRLIATEARGRLVAGSPGTSASRRKACPPVSHHASGRSKGLLPSPP